MFFVHALYVRDSFERLGRCFFASTRVVPSNIAVQVQYINRYSDTVTEGNLVGTNVGSKAIVNRICGEYYKLDLVNKHRSSVFFLNYVLIIISTYIMFQLGLIINVTLQFNFNSFTLIVYNHINCFVLIFAANASA